MHHLKYFLLAGLFALLPACHRGKTDSAGSPDEEGQEPTNRIAIPATVRRNLGITFAQVERRRVANTIRVPGSFELKPLARNEYRMALSGPIEFLVDQFDRIEKGTPLYRFRSLRLLDLRQRVALAEASLRETEATYETARSRQKSLAQADFKKADLDSRVEELNAEINQKQAALNAARAALRNASEISEGANLPDQDGAGEWVEVRARKEGVVEVLAVTNGAFVDETALVLATIDPEQVWFHAMALQSDLSKFKNGQEVRVVPPQSKETDPNQAIPATLQVGLTADPQYRTVSLYALPGESAPWVKPGVSAFLEVTDEETEGMVLAIPRSAVVKDGLTHVFFKRDPRDPNQAIRVEADLGVDDGRWIEVKSGLGPRDEVVLEGVYELKLASSQGGTSQKGGHFHADGTYHDGGD